MRPVTDLFTDRYGRTPEVVWWAPGRVNVIGEFTDYNDGWVLPIAIGFGVACAAARRTDGRLRVASAQVAAEPVTVTLDGLAPGSGLAGWAAYPAGVAWALREAGVPVPGADLLVTGDVPLGAGLSSSAALETATAAALDELAGSDLAERDRTTLARIAQRAENAFVGVPCGLMDQAAALLSVEGHALFFDTRTLVAEPVPFDLPGAGLALLVVDTRAPHRLVEGEYARRRADCEEAAALLGVPALRDVAVADLDGAMARLHDDRLARRVRHVVTENSRVRRAADALRTGNVAAIAPLLCTSHASLRDDYEVTVPELDLAVEAALAAGAAGARMTGGGFGGCIIALVDADRTARVAAAVEAAFAGAGFGPPRCFSVGPGGGARRSSPRPASPTWWPSRRPV